MAKETLGYFVRVRVTGKENAYVLREQCMQAGAQTATVIHDSGRNHTVKALFKGDFPELLRAPRWAGRVAHETVIFDG